MPCDAKTFRDSIVAGSKETAVDWANEYSPVIDVTNTVKKVCPKVTKALLTIYGDDLSKIKVIKVGTVTPVLYPDGRPADISVYGEKAIWNILHNWLAGYEFERQTCEGVSYWVIYPCKLEVQGTLELPCVLSDFVGKDVTKDVTSVVSQYITQPKVTKATLTIYGSKPQKMLGIYDNLPDRYYDGREADVSKYGKDAVTNIVENWLAKQEWERIQCQRTGKWYWVLYPCELKIETEEVKVERFTFKVSPGNPDLKTTATVSWTHTNGWSKGYTFRTRFILTRPNGVQSQIYSTSYYLKSGQTKESSFNFTVPDLPGKYTLIGIVELYELGKWVQDEKASYSWIVSRPGKCSAEDFISGLASHHRTKTPEFDVTKKLLEWNPYKAEPLGVDGWTMIAVDREYTRSIKLRYRLDLVEVADAIEYGYDIPGERDKHEIFTGWVEGHEILRMYCSTDGKWYWVKVPCDLEIVTGDEKDNIVTLSVSSDGVATIKVQNGSYKCQYGTIKHIYLFVDGKEYMHWDLNKLAEKEGYTSATKWWFAHNETFTASVMLPAGLHHVAAVPCYTEKYEPYSVVCKWVKVEAPLIGWEASVDKPTVVAGDTLKIRAKVNWKATDSLKFKLGIDAFGKHYESKEVTPTTSPTIIEVPITVPLDTKEGKYEIKVTLYYE